MTIMALTVIQSGVMSIILSLPIVNVLMWRGGNS